MSSDYLTRNFPDHHFVDVPWGVTDGGSQVSSGSRVTKWFVHKSWDSEDLWLVVKPRIGETKDEAEGIEFDWYVKELNLEPGLSDANTVQLYKPRNFMPRVTGPDLDALAEHSPEYRERALLTRPSHKIRPPFMTSGTYPYNSEEDWYRDATRKLRGLPEEPEGPPTDTRPNTNVLEELEELKTKFSHLLEILGVSEDAL